MTVQADQFKIDGAAWGSEPLALVVEEYDNAEVVKRVRIPLRPVDIEDLARHLWEIRGKYKTALDQMTAALTGPQ